MDPTFGNDKIFRSPLPKFKVYIIADETFFLATQIDYEDDKVLCDNNLWYSLTDVELYAFTGRLDADGQLVFEGDLLYNQNSMSVKVAMLKRTSVSFGVEMTFKFDHLTKSSSQRLIGHVKQRPQFTVDYYNLNLEKTVVKEIN